MLTWKDIWIEGAMTHAEALARCAALNAQSPEPGHWRLPTLAEAQDYRLWPDHSEAPGPPGVDRSEAAIWTSDRYESYTAYNLAFDMGDGADRPALRFGAHPDRRRVLLVRGRGGLYAPEQKFGGWGRWTTGAARIGASTHGDTARIRFTVAHPDLTPRDPIYVSIMRSDDLATSRTLRINQPGESTVEIPSATETLTGIDIEVSPVWYEGERPRGVFLVLDPNS